MKEFLSKLQTAGRLGESETERLVQLLVNTELPQGNTELPQGNTELPQGNTELPQGQVTSSPTDAQIGAYLMHTATRDLDAEELIGAARCLRKHVRPVSYRGSERPLLDTCGTGGSGFETFNTSTAVAFVCAGAGQPVAKHGNRAASSKSGSADVLEALGIAIDLPPNLVGDCLAETGFCFMFAPLHHPATKRVAVIRRELGLRTIFNFLGPLVNPAGARVQLLGVSNRALLMPMAEALRGLGTERALVVYGHDGLDEISITGSTTAIRLSAGIFETFEINPSDFGLSTVPMSAISVGSPGESAAVLQSVLNGEASAYQDLVVLNAGAALLVSGAASSMAEGIELARVSIDGGHARAVLGAVQEFSAKHRNG